MSGRISYILVGTFSLISAFLYYFLLHHIARTNFPQTVLCWGLLFTGYFVVLWPLFREKSLWGEKSKTIFWILLGAAVLFRLIAFFALPELSDDYFRFVWDGRLWVNGENPFSKLPSAYEVQELARLGLDQQLFDQLNSPNYHTIYPPVCQGIFALSAILFPSNIYGSVLVMKSFFLLAELGSIWLIFHMLRHLKIATSQLFLYALNPLVIVEIGGNLHFEGIMIFFLLGSLYLLMQRKRHISAIAFGLAVCSKLIPLMFLPLLILRIGFWRAVAYGAIVFAVTFFAFLPIFDLDTLLHLLESVQLYFQTFEFNASLYYLFRALGQWFSGYNLIKYIGPSLSLVSFLLILFISFRTPKFGVDRLPQLMMAVLLIYLLLATTVHPWYATTLIALGSLTKLRFPFIWSALLILTYSAYQTTAYTENLWLVGIGYTILCIVLYIERKKWR